MGKKVRERDRKREDESKVEVTVFYNLLSKVTSHYCCHNPFVGSKSLVSSPYRKGGSDMGYEYQEVRIIGKYFKHRIPQAPRGQIKINSYVYVTLPMLKRISN